MARLKILVLGEKFKTGRGARIWLDDVDISRNTRRLELTVDATEAITAVLHLYVSELDLELPANIRRELVTK